MGFTLVINGKISDRKKIFIWTAEEGEFCLWKVRINIGSIITEFMFCPALCIGDLKSSLCHRYKHFITDSEPDITYLVFPEKTKKHIKKVSVVQSEKNLQISRYDFYSETDFKRKSGVVRIRYNQFSFDSFIRILYSCLILRKGGILLHASAGVFSKGGIIFPGRTGAGKTTIVQQFINSKVINDEIIGLRKIDNNFIVFSTPFWGSGGKFLAEKGYIRNCKLMCICFPVKSDKLNFELISPKKSLEKLMQTVLYFGDSRFYIQRILEILYKVTKNTKSYQMKFYPAKDLYKKIYYGIQNIR